MPRGREVGATESSRNRNALLFFPELTRSRLCQGNCPAEISRLNNEGGEIQVTTSSNSEPVTSDRSRLIKTRSVLASTSAFSASSALVPPLVAALGPSDQMTAIALDVSVTVADAQPLAVEPVAVVQILSRVAFKIFDMPALLIPLAVVNGRLMPFTVELETA
jgi:hypothetical protein